MHTRFGLHVTCFSLYCLHLDYSGFTGKKIKSMTTILKKEVSYLLSANQKAVKYTCSTERLVNDFTYSYSILVNFTLCLLALQKGQNLDPFLQAFLSSTVEPTKRKPLPK